MSLSVETLAVARKYTDDSLAGAGAVAGVPCKIQSITAITGGNRVTFLWTDNNGDDHTSAMDVMNGVDGEDGKGIQSISVNAQNHLIITYTDGTTVDAGQIEIHSSVDSVNGQTGAVVLDAEDVGALPDNTPIPSKTSDLTNDSGFATTSDVSTALADYTKTADLTTLLAAKQDTLTFDNVPTENSNNPVKSGGVYAANQTLTNNVDVLIENGAINLLPIKCPNQTENNVTLTNNNDGSVTISGTASTNTYFYLLENSRSHLEIIEGTGKSYTLSGCTSGSGSTYTLRMLGSTDLVAWYTVGQIQTTEEMTFTEGAYPYYAVRLDVFSGASVNVTIKPMLVDSKYKGAYQPYAKTNKELTDESKLITLPATKNDSIVGSFVIRVRKQHNAVYVTGYLSITVAANINDLLFTISELNFFDADDKFYIQMMSSAGSITFAEVNSNGAVKVGSNAGMPTGYYMVDSVLLMK